MTRFALCIYYEGTSSYSAFCRLVSCLVMKASLMVGGRRGVGTRNLSGLSRIDPKNMFPKIFLPASTC